MSKCCGCMLCNKKFLNENGEINKLKLALILERTETEFLDSGCERQIAFDLINGWLKLKCKCDCHKI